MLYLSLYESTEDPHDLGLYKEIILAVCDCSHVPQVGHNCASFLLILCHYNFCMEEYGVRRHWSKTKCPGKYVKKLFLMGDEHL